MLEGPWEGFSLKRYVHETERAVIERALRAAAGSVTTAARLLGYKHHQSLISLINTRHRELIGTRSPAQKRRRRIVSVTGTDKLKGRLDANDYGVVRILYVEDNEAVANIVREAVLAENVRCDHLADGPAALKILKGAAADDVLIVDNDVPGLSGLELVLRCKSLRHRKNMPIAMLSGDDIEKEAWRAGVHEFLRKPRGLNRLASTVSRFIAANKENETKEQE